MKKYQHIPVLLKEAISGLNIKPNGIYIDCTMGGAGHAAEILKRLDNRGHLYCFEHDDAVITNGREILSPISDNYTIIHDNFVNIKQRLREHEVSFADGILYDLGVSSFHFDISERGFSYHAAARLDMRMDRRQRLTAYDIVNKSSYEELKEIFYRYGEERYATSIARRIIAAREKQPIVMTTELADIIIKSVPSHVRRLDSHPAKKVFQALRIAVNDELNNLESSLNDAILMLNKEGRTVVISFHSLEDRIIKTTYRKYAQPPLPRGLPIKDKDIIRNYRIVNKRVIVPSEVEKSVNKRARSAKMRILEKI